MAFLRALSVLALFSGFFAMSGCGRHLPYLIHDKAVAPALSGTTLTQELHITDNSTIDLTTLTDKPVVLMFLSESCTSCQVETTHFVSLLSNKTANPNLVNVFSVVVGSNVQATAAWKTLREVPWNVASDESGEVFRQVCSGRVFPCTVVQMPGKGVVLQRETPVTFESLVQITGSWQG